MNQIFLEQMQNVQPPRSAMTQEEMQRILAMACEKVERAQCGSLQKAQTAEKSDAPKEAAQPGVAQNSKSLHAAPRRKRRPLRTLLIAAAVACCLMASVYAVSEFYKMQQGEIPFYEAGSGATSQLVGLQTQMESYNAAVNQSVEHAGTTLTLDNVAVNGNVISAFFTLRNEQPIDWSQFGVYGDGVSEPDWVKLQWAAASVACQISDKSGVLCESYETAIDYHEVDDKTFQYMVRIVPTQRLPDTFTLSLKALDLLMQFGTSWDYVVPIDITDMAKPAALQAQDIVLPMQEGTKTLRLNYFALTPFGATAAAKPMEKFVPAQNPETEMGSIEMVENAFDLLRCQITDDKGNTLYPLMGPDSGGKRAGADVSVEYTGSEPDAKSITFTPISVDEAVAKAYPDENRLRTVNVTELGAKLEMTDIGGYIFKDYKVEDSTITVVLEPYGYAFLPDITLNDDGVSIHTKETEDADNPGQIVEIELSGLQHRMQDYKTGDVTVSVSYYKATNEELRGIESFTYYYDAGFFLDTDAAVTLPLE